MRRTGSIPLWNPYQCGGVSYFRNPQALAYSPTYWLLVWPFGTWFGAKVYLVVHAAFSGVGMARLVHEEFGRSRLASLAATAFFTMSGFFAWQLRVGHVTFIVFFLAPWIFLYWRKSWREPRFALIAGAFVALGLLEGGHIATPHFALWVGLDALLSSVRRPRLLPTIARAGAIFATAVIALAAYRLAPVLVSAVQHDAWESAPDSGRLAIGALFRSLTALDAAEAPGSTYLLHETALFVGWPVLMLAVTGACFAIARVVRRESHPEDLPLLALTATFVLLTMGAFSTFAPWTLLHKLPLYRSLHVSTRFGALMTFYLALLAASAVDAIRAAGARLPTRDRFAVRSGVLAAVLLAVGLLAYVNAPVAAAWQRPLVAATEEPFHIAPMAAHDFREGYANSPERNVGATHCYEPIVKPPHPELRLGNVPQAWVVPSGAGDVTNVDIGPTGFRATVTTTQAATLHFNQRFDGAFRSDQGRVEIASGRTTVVLDGPVDGVVAVRYVPDYLGIAGPMSLVSALLTLAYFARRRFIRRRSR